MSFLFYTHACRRGHAPRTPGQSAMKVVRLSALRTGRLYPPGDIPGNYFCQRLSRPQRHSSSGRIKPIKNLNGPIWNRTRDLPVCSVVPQSNAPPRASLLEVFHYVYLIFINPYDSRCSNYDADWTIQGSNPVRGNRRISSPKRVDILWVPLNLFFQLVPRAHGGAQDVRVWSTSHDCSCTPEKEMWYLLTRGLIGPQTRCGRF